MRSGADSAETANPNLGLSKFSRLRVHFRQPTLRLSTKIFGSLMVPPMATGASIAAAILTALLLSTSMIYAFHSKKQRYLRRTVELHPCAVAEFLTMFWPYSASWQPYHLAAAWKGSRSRREDLGGFRLHIPRCRVFPVAARIPQRS